MKKEKKVPTLGYSVLTLTTLILFIALGFAIYKIDFSVLMFMSWLLIGMFALRLGFTFNELEGFAYESAKKSIPSSAIILAVGIVIAAFMAAGTVPTILVWGLKIITPELFLVVTFLLCCVTSLATGTSWGTAGTVGVAMIGVGAGLGINPGITAGAIVSGSYFGDKMSPVSDTTILAAALSDTDIWDHIKAMCYSTIPAAMLCVIVYLFIGFTGISGSYDATSANQVISALEGIFNISFITLLPLIVIITLIMMRKSTVTSLLIGSVVAGVIAVVYQGFSINEIGLFFAKGFIADSNDPFITGIINRGGLTTLISLIAVFVGALGIGGMLTQAGFMTPIFEAIVKRVKSQKGVLLSAYIVTWISILLVPTYNFAFVMGSTLFKEPFEKYNLHSSNLSRILEDCGTLGGTLMPWSTGPIFFAGVLGVSSTIFCPYVLLSIFVPLISLFFILTGIAIRKIEPKVVVEPVNV